MINKHQIRTGLQGHPHIKNMIAIASGKGGVGKSTTSVNLALALQQQGAKVGLLDADIYGPSQPHLLGSNERPTSKDKQSLEPVIRYQLQTMSIGYLIDVDSPMVWRGPMVSKALQQLINDTQWHDLDYLIIDLPPGTGDIQLTLAQKIPLTAAVIVTTPQDLALIDARKALSMFEKVNIPVLGIIENMSYFTCPHCDQTSFLFGQNGGLQLSQHSQTELLGQIPLTLSIRQKSDAGEPITVSEPDSEIAQCYQSIASKVATELSLQPKRYDFPTIEIETKT